MHNNRSKFKAAVIALTAAFAFTAVNGFGCSRAGNFSFDELFKADVIVRATAEKYVGTPDLARTTTGVPDAEVEFSVDEVLRGSEVPKVLTLHAYLSGDDDLNDQNVPYTFVRPGGRRGSCYANSYKKGAQFLLFLRKTADSYTSNISPLGPTNEQLTGAEDPWLIWARKETRRRKG